MKKKRNAPDTLVDGVVGQLAVAEQIRHVLADVFGAELVRRTLEVARESPRWMRR